MSKVKSFIVFILIASFLTALSFIYFKEYIVPKRYIVQDSTIVMEKVNKVLKLVTVEGNFSEIHKHTEFYGVDFSPFRKKALIRINAKVLVGYDLEKINMEIDEASRTIFIAKFPEPDILSIEDNIEYYDITEGMFTSFSNSDYNSFQKIGKEKIREVAKKSKLIETAAEQKNDMLEILNATLNSIGWKLVTKEEKLPLN